MSDRPLAPDEIATCLRVLRALVEDRTLLADVPEEERQALLQAAGQVSRPARSQMKQLAKVIRHRERLARKERDLSLVAAAGMRRERTRLPLSGVTVGQLDALGLPAPPEPGASGGGPAEEEELLEPRACYVCKADYRRVHFFYHAMCPACAALNYAKRTQTAPMGGRVALVTGARLKIGYAITLMLLRAGARVIATTRFPHDAAERYAREPDFDAFADRLELHGLDLRHAPSVELFTQHLDRRLDRLDFLINNAAQTVRRPPAFYAHLLPREALSPSALSEGARRILVENERLRAELMGEAEGPAGGGALAPRQSARGVGLVAWQGGSRALGLLEAARLSQLPSAPEDLLAEASGPHAFPPGAVDLDRQQIDARTVNSWRLTLAEVSTPELLEVHLVNAVAPFILNSRLKPLMTRERTFDKHIVNVSAMEAQFSRNKKTERHPHTNMAKAALNMMTRTSAVDYAQDGIFMNSVDTGWVTDEDPLHHVARKQRVHDFHPPLDAIDGAARVLDPIFTGLNTGQHVYGMFLKDYRPVAW